MATPRSKLSFKAPKKRNASTENLQDNYFRGKIRDCDVVSILLSTGLSVSGTILQVDKFCILLSDSDDNKHLLFKQNIVKVTKEKGAE